MAPVASFTAGDTGEWRIEAINAVAGEGLPPAAFLSTTAGEGGAEQGGAGLGAWTLRGVASNTRYTERAEATTLGSRQEGLGRPGGSRAVLIPMRKSDAWWALAQDERRAIFAAQSDHIGIGLDVLPAVARRLLHARDLGEPFDFLTWFEFAPEATGAFDAMLARLRATVEWTFVEREVEVRLTRA